MKQYLFPVLCLIMLSSFFLYGMDEEIQDEDAEIVHIHDGAVRINDTRYFRQEGERSTYTLTSSSPSARQKIFYVHLFESVRGEQVELVWDHTSIPQRYRFSGTTFSKTEDPIAGYLWCYLARPTQ